MPTLVVLLDSDANRITDGSNSKKCKFNFLFLALWTLLASGFVAIIDLLKLFKRVIAFAATIIIQWHKIAPF
jgi:hypothetical protein